MRRGAVAIFGVVLALGCGRADAKLSTEEVQRLFHQANEAFRKANEKAGEPEAERLYTEAILNYRQIIKEGGIENAKLYYNLANAYFLKQDLGRAILNYRRAERLSAANTRIAKNLAFARSKRIDQIRLKSEQRVLQTLFFWHYDFSLRTKFVLACVFFAVVCGALTVMIWLGRSAAGTATVAVAAILLLCFGTSVIVQARAQAGAIGGVITVEKVIARQGDGNNYPASFKEPLHSGTEFDVLEQRAGWMQIELADETDCWIPATAAEVI
jgi:hypothetical protein